MNSASSHTSQPSGMRPKLPPRPPVDRDMPKRTNKPGSANRLMWPARSNRSVVACRRCSDGIAGSRWKQMLADKERAAVLETLELDLRMLGARGVDDERAQPIAALDGSLRDVDVLHARAGH